MYPVTPMPYVWFNAFESCNSIYIGTLDINQLCSLHLSVVFSMG